MRPVKSMHSRDSVSGELSRSQGCRPVAPELLGLPPDCQSLKQHLCAEVGRTDPGQKLGVGSEEGEHWGGYECCRV